MKKIVLAVFLSVLVLGLIACGGKAETATSSSVAIVEDSIVLQDAVAAFEATGTEMIAGVKPDLETLGTKDAVSYIYGGTSLTLYEFESEETYQSALKIFPSMKEYPKNGNVVMEVNITVTDEMKEIFNNVKK